MVRSKILHFVAIFVQFDKSIRPHPGRPSVPPSPCFSVYTKLKIPGNQATSWLYCCCEFLLFFWSNKEFRTSNGKVGWSVGWYLWGWHWISDSWPLAGWASALQGVEGNTLFIYHSPQSTCLHSLHIHCHAPLLVPTFQFSLTPMPLCH